MPSSPIAPQQTASNPPPWPPPSTPISSSSSSLFLPPHPAFPSNSSIQTNLLLNSILLRHLQQNQRCPATSTGGGGIQASPMLFCPESSSDFFGHPQQQMNGGANPAAMFARNIDSLYNFISPNVVLLPIAYHSLSDEQHIQLLGMPQTVIPVAVHPQMLGQFPVRPLLIEPALTKMANLCTGLPSQVPIIGHKDGALPGQFSLPIGFRQSIFSPPAQFPTVNNADACSQTEKPPQNSQSANAMAEVEPLDLSMTGNSCSSKNHHHHHHAARKRTAAHQGRGGGGKTEDGQPKRVKSEGNHCYEPNTILLNSSSSSHHHQQQILPNFLHPASTNGVPNGNVTTMEIAASISPSILKTMATAANVPTLAAADGTTSTPKKKFPCDLCGDVSFLLLETLEGHKKYYCRNRARPDPTEASTAAAAANAARVPIIKSSQQTTTPTREAATIIPLQCPQCSTFQASNQEQLAAHQRQMHPLPFGCVVCGYKAFTIRGLRTHVRLSHAQAEQKRNDNEEGKEESDRKNGGGASCEVRKSPLVEIKQEKTA